MSQREIDAQAWARGVCTCKAAGKWRYADVGMRRVLVCVKCGRPKYWPEK